ncbi:hypothetical protein PHJA_000905500, partial [Phtheirospermum japonicum]
CTECRCDLYNVTGRLLPKNYKGGLRCGYDEAICKVKEGFQGAKRSLYLRYKVMYVNWDDLILPVKKYMYILDVTYMWTKADESSRTGDRHRCLVEYDVVSRAVGGANDHCTHTRTLTVSLSIGRDVIKGLDTSMQEALDQLFMTREEEKYARPVQFMGLEMNPETRSVTLWARPPVTLRLAPSRFLLGRCLRLSLIIAVQRRILESWGSFTS